MTTPKTILFTENALCLTPVEWTSADNHWTVYANEAPEVSYNFMVYTVIMYQLV